MGRLSFKAVNREDELFGKREGGKGGLQLSRVPFEVPPSSSSSSSSSKGRRSFCRNLSSVSTALSIVSSRKSFSYDKLSQVPIHLTIIKLDGSSFGIEVIKMATISDLKQTVESYFSNLPSAETGKIFWRHEWTQFCLSYRGQKLLMDSEYIRNYGVRDGDVLRFVRHVSIDYNLIKKRSRKQIEASKPCITTENKEEETSKVEEAFDDQENLSCQVEDNSSRSESMLFHLFRGWFLYSRVSNNDQLKFEGQANQSKWTGVGGLRGIEVKKMATISDLKQAAESYFSNLPTAETGNISWRHVWTQFCISHCGQMLLIDGEYIRNYAVRDSDEFRFVQHVSIAYNLINKRSRKQKEAAKPCITSVG